MTLAHLDIRPNLKKVVPLPAWGNLFSLSGSTGNKRKASRVPIDKTSTSNYTGSMDRTKNYVAGLLQAAVSGALLGSAFSFIAGGPAPSVGAAALVGAVLFVHFWVSISRACAAVVGPWISGPGPARLTEWERSRSVVWADARRWLKSPLARSLRTRARRCFAAVRPRSTRRMFRPRSTRRASSAAGSSNDGDGGGGDPPAPPLSFSTSLTHPALWPARPGNGVSLFLPCSEGPSHE